MKILFLLIFLPFKFFSQLFFEFRWGNDRIIPQTTYTYSKDQTIEFEELKLYLSDFLLESNNQLNKIADVRLIDFEDSLSCVLIPTYFHKAKSNLIFNLGLDSSYHVNMDYSGPLDPVHGMYWAWNTGYINFKMVANCSESKERNNLLDYHLGGYLKPNQTNFKIEMNDVSKTIFLDLLPLFEKKIIQPEEIARVVIPGKDANKIMKFLSNAFFHD